jgi:hypothetical protein
MDMTLFSKELFTHEANNIFTFGSNLAGRHGAGAAKFAKEYCGAQYGNGFGLQGKSFAIPTKDEFLRVLPLNAIEQYVRQFLYFALQNPNLTFYVTRIGCGLSGYQDSQIAPMFADSPQNCILPDAWKIKENTSLVAVDNSIK